MKKIIFFLIFLSLVVGFASVQATNVNIFIDKRMELISIVQLLSGYDDVGYYESDYKQDVLEYFSAYKDHPAVTALFNLWMYGALEHQKPYKLMLYLTQPPEMEIDISKVPEDLILSSRSEKDLLDFIALMNCFYNESNFEKFYTSHQNTYQSYKKDFIENVDLIELVDSLKNFYGFKLNTYNIYLVPLANGGYNIRHNNKDGSIVIGLIEQENGEYGFVRKDNPPGYTKKLLLHEFGHTYINRITAKNKTLLKKYEYLYRPISNDMQSYGYTSWYSALNEHIINAVAIKIITNKYGTYIGEKYLNFYKSKGFRYIEGLYNQLEKYENNRDEFKNFEVFFPELIMVLEKLD